MATQLITNNLDAEFNHLYLPHLRQYVTPVVSNPLKLGSGVLVNVRGRHFVLTAAHCIESSTQVLRCQMPKPGSRVGETKPLRILHSRTHKNPEIDIGYLEIQDPECPEIQLDQLCTDRIIEGLVHVVGYPVTEVQLDLKRKEVSLLERHVFNITDRGD